MYVRSYKHTLYKLTCIQSYINSYFRVFRLYAHCRWILKNLGDDLTENDIDDMIADVDTDGSGWVDYHGRTYSDTSISTNIMASRLVALQQFACQ